MTKDLEELEARFILKEDVEHEDIKTLVDRVMKFCKIDSNGYVLISAKGKTTISDRILLVLTARYLANRLQHKLGKKTTIVQEGTNKELAKMLGEKESVIKARIKELKDEKKVIPVKKGVYRIAPYAIEGFLTKLES